MNLTSPLLKAGMVDAPGDSATSLLRVAADNIGLWADDGADGGLGLLMSGLAGTAAALAVAIVLCVYFRTGYRSTRDIIRHGLAGAAVLGLLCFAAYDMRHAALAYLGINPAKPSVGVEMLPLKNAAATVACTQLGQHHPA